MCVEQMRGLADRPVRSLETLKNNFLGFWFIQLRRVCSDLPACLRLLFLIAILCTCIKWSKISFTYIKKQWSNNLTLRNFIWTQMQLVYSLFDLRGMIKFEWKSYIAKYTILSSKILWYTQSNDLVGIHKKRACSVFLLLYLYCIVLLNKMSHLWKSDFPLSRNSHLKMLFTE